VLYSPTEQTDLFEEYALDSRSRISSGYACLDKQMRGGGLAPGDLMMVIGRTEVGKTFFALNLIANMAQHGVLFLSLEMTVPQVWSRLACMRFGLDPWALEGGLKAGSKESRKWLERYAEEYPSLWVYKPTKVEGAGFDDFSKAVHDYEEHMGERPRIVALDFLGLARRDAYSGAEQQRIPRLATEAERWADAEQVSLLLLHQTGRANEGDPTRRNHGHIPLTLEDAMYGGEQHADYMLGLYRPEREPPPSRDSDDEEYLEWAERVQEAKDKVYVQLLKNRHGPRPIESTFPGWQFKWEWPSGKMTEVSQAATMQTSAAYSVKESA
jgi:replicative DNA helicase